MMTAAVIQSSILLSVALCAAGVLRRQSAAVRHAILATGMISSIRWDGCRGVFFHCRCLENHVARAP